MADSPTLSGSVIEGPAPAERHYAPWVKARQQQLESDVIRAWRNDPIAQRETLRCNTGPQGAGDQRMTATFPRHQNIVVPN